MMSQHTKEIPLPFDKVRLKYALVCYYGKDTREKSGRKTVVRKKGTVRGWLYGVTWFYDTKDECLQEIRNVFSTYFQGFPKQITIRNNNDEIVEKGDNFKFFKK